jgi:hypothetical protein
MPKKKKKKKKKKKNDDILWYKYKYTHRFVKIDYT